MPFTPRLVLVTTSSVEEARQLTKGIMAQHLAACVNILPAVESHYVWKGELKRDEEVMMLIKSSAEQFETLAGFIRKHHSYECPEILSISPNEISPGYRSWWDEVMMQDGDKATFSV
jgi:periplasmic divalent cation tolerance protein